MYVYTFQNNCRTPHLLNVYKMDKNCNVDNLYKLVVSNLKDFFGMDDYEIAIKLICVGIDGASVMQGNWNGHCVRL